MQYQTFSGQDLKEALVAIRAAYGPEALIGPTRHVHVAGENGLPQMRVEVQAAPSQGRSAWPFSSGLLPETNRTPATSTRPKRSVSLAPSPDSRASVASPSVQSPERRAPETHKPGGGMSLSRMEAQLAELRAMVEAVQAQLPTKQRALGLLSAMGIEGQVARQLGARLGKAKTDAELLALLGSRIERALPVAPNPLTSQKPELIACVGPTGVGKTTTLAKLAAQARLEHGRSVAIISLDHFRVGAADQWARYGKLMGVPVFAPKTARELEEVLSQNPAELLLVDTPSVGSSEDASMRAFSELAHKARRSTHVLLLLPAWLRGNDAERLICHYEHVSPTGLVVTKLDETDGVGGMIQASLGADLPIVYLSRGPRVPEHLEPASAETVTRLALSRALSH